MTSFFENLQVYFAVATEPLTIDQIISAAINSSADGGAYIMLSNAFCHLYRLRIPYSK